MEERGNAEPVAFRFATLWRVVGATLIVVVIVLSLVPDPPQIPADSENWTGHLLAYGTLMGWFARLQPRFRTRVAFAVSFCLMGVALEFLQGMTDYRTYDAFDMLANAAGVGLGWTISPPRVPSGLDVVDAWLSALIHR